MNAGLVEVSSKTAEGLKGLRVSDIPRTCTTNVLLSLKAYNIRHEELTVFRLMLFYREYLKILFHPFVRITLCNLESSQQYCIINIATVARQTYQ